MGRAWRVYHEDLPAAAGTEIELSRDESHHLIRVLRLGSGDRVRVFDGRGSEWRATVVEARRREALLRLEEPCASLPEPPLRLTLHQGLCRRDRMDWIAQKATEIGVAEIRFWSAARSDGPAPSGHRLDRWHRIILEAAKQSGRQRLPALRLESALPAPEKGVPALLLDPSPGAAPLASLIAGAAPREAWLAIGPESGLEPGERDQAAASGWTPAGLGPRVMRTETAGIVGAAILLHVWGDLGAGGPFRPV